MARDGLAVEGVGVYGMPYSREVDPNLVRPPRFQAHPQHRVPRSLVHDLEVRNRRPPNPRGHEGRVRGVPSHRRVDRPRARQPLPDDQGPVDTPYAPLRERRHESRVGFLALRKHHETGGVPVQAVYDSRTLRVLPARDAPTQKRVDQRPRTIPRSRVYHEPCGLVHHQKVFILEDQRNGDVLGFQALLDEPGLYPFPAAQLVSRGGLGALNPH